MSYVRSVLQPDERVRYLTDIHWIIFLPGIALFVLAALLYLLALSTTAAYVFWAVVAAILFIVAAGLLLAAWFRRITTEIAVTDRRVILKRGLIRRHTVEMNMQKVESVDVDQTLLGRIFNYGNVTVRGTGSSFETIRRIDSPLRLRTTVTAR